ncbi:DUF4349 domain-containing protein [Kineococcus sp. NUM-3379]
MAASLLAAALLLGSAGCSGGGSEATGGAASQSAADAPAGLPAASGGGGQGIADTTGVQGTSTGGTAPAPGDEVGPGVARAVVSTGTVAVEVADVDAAADEVTRLTAAAGGLVTASRSGSGSGPGQDAGAGSGQARMTLRVPGDRFAALLQDVAALGRRTELSTTSTDVTAEVADVDSRVTSARAVLETFRGRLPQTASIPDVLALEGEIARRQADLDALLARQRVLRDQVALATAEVTLTGRTAVAASTATPTFTGGLGAGWGALVATSRFVALALGALLPFAAVAAAVGIPLVVWRRRRARVAPAGGPPA